MAIRARRNPTVGERLAPAEAEERRRALECVLRERRRLLALAFTGRDVSPDPLDAARHLEEERVWLAVMDRSSEFQVQIDEAMRLLSEGRYGQCIECGKRIPAARIRALPFALRCLCCQERYETGKGAVQARAAQWGTALWSDESEGGDEP